ncbi:two-component system sensor histidine kinase NtrB [Litorimonas haliclonae]|uniref:two-component system sensor histidine kinase NtrB n=1 Tax=Litorimonas haliclonae TaxID=2081977 RepID=UPI0039F0A56B
MSNPALGTHIGEDAPYPCFLVDPETQKVAWANDAAQSWTGLSVKGLSKQDIWTILNIQDVPRDRILQSFDEGSAVTVRDCEIKFEHRKGAEVQLSHVTSFSTQGHIGLGIRFAKAQPRNNRMGGQVVSGMGRLIAHELKNPLAGIKGAAQLLREDVSNEEGQSLIDLISSEIDRIRRLADRMETLGDSDPEIEEQVNIHEILRRARKIIQSADKNLVFTEHYDPSLPHAAGDPDTLMQAVLNLIKNASEAGTEITLQTKFRSGVSATGEGEEKSQSLPIEVQIIDNGPGIPADLVDQVFQPFMSTKQDGQGLGLALVSKVAAAHGGVVEVRSHPGHTAFSLLLPAPRPKNERPNTESPDNEI